MAIFEPIVQWVLYQEDDRKSPGKIVDLGDGGGLTRLGLTQRWYAAELPANFFTTLDFKSAVAAAKIVYREKHWRAILGDGINSDVVAAMLLSWAVNDIPSVAIHNIQQVVGVTTDGKMGPNTLAEINSKDPDMIVRLYRAEWITLYQNIVRFNPAKQEFLNGWINRANFPYPSPLVGKLYE